MTRLDGHFLSRVLGRVIHSERWLDSCRIIIINSSSMGGWLVMYE